MCGQFVVVPKEVVEEIIRDIEMKRSANAMPDWPSVRQPASDLFSSTALESAAEPSAYPKSEVPVIVPNGGRLSAQVMTWGHDVSWSKQVVFNTRFDTATRPGQNMWTHSLAHRRCLVPTFGFFEPHQSEICVNPRTGKLNRQKYFFTLPGQQVLFLAGLYENDHFSVMTTEPNAVMHPIHNRMPVILQPDELETWLYGDYLSLADRNSVQLNAMRK